VGKKRSGELNGFLDRATTIEGELRFHDTMRIEGTIRGRIVSGGLLVVGESAVIDAEIDVDSITVEGKVSGVLRARQRVEVHAGAELRADVRTPILRIDEGAIFQGHCDMDMGEAPTTDQVDDRAPTRFQVIEGAGR